MSPSKLKLQRARHSKKGRLLRKEPYLVDCRCSLGGKPHGRTLGTCTREPSAPYVVGHPAAVLVSSKHWRALNTRAECRTAYGQEAHGFSLPIERVSPDYAQH